MNCMRFICCLLTLLLSISSADGQSSGLRSRPRPRGRVSGNAEAAVKADLQEAISLLQKKQYLLFTHDFLTEPLAWRVLDRSQRDLRRARSDSSTRMLSPQPFDAAALGKDVSVLLPVLQQAVQGKMTFNNSQDVVQILTVLHAEEILPDTAFQNVPVSSERPSAPVQGLGRDLPAMLTQAADQLKSGQLELFVKNVYPLSELAQLEAADNMKRLLARMDAQPRMLERMQQDLLAAAKAARSQSPSGNTARLQIPDANNARATREVRFEVVDNHWRFFDGSRAWRKSWLESTTRPAGKYVIPAQMALITLEKKGDRWRLQDPPRILQE